MKKLLALLMLLTLLCPVALAETTLYVSGNACLHLRAEPSQAAKSLGLYYPGTPVTVLDWADAWWKVQIGDQVGWMAAEYLQETPAPMTGPVDRIFNAESDRVDLWQGATTKSSPLAQVDEDDLVLVLGETADGWSYVDWRNQRGFILTAFRQPDHAGRTGIAGQAQEGFIHRYVADNAQALYFVALEEKPIVFYQDVNFDGAKDVVVHTAMGSSNAWVAFFVWDGGKYVMAQHPGVEGIVNYGLYPEEGIVACRANNGSAGALFEHTLLRWAGTDLELLRRAVSEELTETVFDHERLTTTIWMDRLHVRVWDYTGNEPGGTLLYEAVHPADALDAAFFPAISDMLWQDLR